MISFHPCLQRYTNLLKQTEREGLFLDGSYMCVDQRWAVIFLKGPHWLLDFNERASQVVEKDQRLIKKSCSMYYKIESL